MFFLSENWYFKLWLSFKKGIVRILHFSCEKTMISSSLLLENYRVGKCSCEYLPNDVNRIQKYVSFSRFNKSKLFCQVVLLYWAKWHENVYICFLITFNRPLTHLCSYTPIPPLYNCPNKILGRYIFNCKKHFLKMQFLT